MTEGQLLQITQIAKYMYSLLIAHLIFTDNSIKALITVFSEAKALLTHGQSWSLQAF